MWIVYFDGECNVCNGFVDFLLRHDRRRLYRYAPLQGSTAAQRLPLQLRGPELATMVLEKDHQFMMESTAALHTVAGLGGIYKATLSLLLVPSLLRDFVYRWIARNRYHWFGKRDQCRVPSVEERELFLP